MADPEVSSNNTEYQKLVRAVSDIQVGAECWDASGGGSFMSCCVLGCCLASPGFVSTLLRRVGCRYLCGLRHPGKAMVRTRTPHATSWAS